MWDAMDAGSIRAQSVALTIDAVADGEGVWSWRPWAGAKLARSGLAGDGD